MWRLRRQAGSPFFVSCGVSCWQNDRGQPVYFARIPGGRSVEPYRPMPLQDIRKSFEQGPFVQRRNGDEGKPGKLPAEAMLTLVAASGQTAGVHQDVPG